MLGGKSCRVFLGVLGRAQQGSLMKEDEVGISAALEVLSECGVSFPFS